MAEKVYEMFTEYNDVVTVDEVMEMLHLGRVTVYNLLKTDKIHTLRVGKEICHTQEKRDRFSCRIRLFDLHIC